MKMKKTVLALMLVLLTGITVSAALAQPPQPEVSALSPIRIESASVLPPGEMALDVGLAFELGRELRNLEYDNLRLAPLGMRYGVMDSLEIGGFIAFSANDRDDIGAPDDSGLEGLSFFGKLELNKFAALKLGLNVAGDDDVFPYPSDGFDMFVDLALRRLMGKGLLYGEFGYTVQGGDLDNNSYFSYGFGYVFPVSEKVGLSAELSGDEAHFGTSVNTLDLLLGANFVVTKGLRLAPYTVIGLFDAGPDFAFGGAMELRF